MYQKTLSYYIAMLYRSFADFTGDKLQEVGLNFGLLFFIVYIGKKPNCTPSELTKALSLDWGHSQRCINRLTDDGFITKEKSGRHKSVVPVKEYPVGGFKSLLPAFCQVEQIVTP